jgi:hypothetical protein
MSYLRNNTVFLYDFETLLLQTVCYSFHQFCFVIKKQTSTGYCFICIITRKFYDFKNNPEMVPFLIRFSQKSKFYVEQTRHLHLQAIIVCA